MPWFQTAQSLLETSIYSKGKRNAHREVDGERGNGADSIGNAYLT